MIRHAIALAAAVLLTGCIDLAPRYRPAHPTDAAHLSERPGLRHRDGGEAGGAVA